MNYSSGPVVVSTMNTEFATIIMIMTSNIIVKLLSWSSTLTLSGDIMLDYYLSPFTELWNPNPLNNMILLAKCQQHLFIIWHTHTHIHTHTSNYTHWCTYKADTAWYTHTRSAYYLPSQMARWWSGRPAPMILIVRLNATAATASATVS